MGLPDGQMGRAAHGATRPCSRILAGSVPAADPLLAEISAFLARPEDDDDPGALERALTDGYARVLSLETDRVRLDKQITRLLTGIEITTPRPAAGCAGSHVSASRAQASSPACGSPWPSSAAATRWR